MAEVLELLLKSKYGAHVYIDRTQSLMVGDSAFKKAKATSNKTTESDIRWDSNTLTMIEGTHFSNADRLFAQALGIHFIEATDFFGWRKYGVDVVESVKDLESLLKICHDCTL